MEEQQVLTPWEEDSDQKWGIYTLTLDKLNKNLCKTEFALDKKSMHKTQCNSKDQMNKGNIESTKKIRQFGLLKKFEKYGSLYDNKSVKANYSIDRKQYLLKKPVKSKYLTSQPVRLIDINSTVNRWRKQQLSAWQTQTDTSMTPFNNKNRLKQIRVKLLSSVQYQKRTLFQRFNLFKQMPLNPKRSQLKKI